MTTIFVQIASYRDPELMPTIADALQKATYPQRLSFGVVWQGKVGCDRLPLERMECCRVLMVDSDRARGVGWARSKTQSLWEGETYTMQIDSHMRFAPGWDETLITMLHQCPSVKPVLTAYPPAYTPPNILHAGEPTRLAASHFHAQGSLSLVSGTSLAHCNQPQLGLFIAAGFWFARSQFIQDVPYDPHIYFYGEELNLTVRAWTNGWDIYHPNQIVCFHEYNRPGKPRHWQDHANWWQLDQFSHQRLHQLLNPDSGGIPLSSYGLGCSRSLSAYEIFSGVNFRTRTLTDTARKGIPTKDYYPLALRLQ